jgi:hypothetical protein
MATTKAKPRTKKYFTVQQANATLPLVRAIVRDVVELARTLQERQERVDRLQPGPAEPGRSDAYHEELREVRRELLRDKQRMREYTIELHDLGIELKDPLTGLVDFPSLREGREVCLCWMQGETEVRHWHEREAGFSGRQAIPDPSPG